MLKIKRLFSFILSTLLIAVLIFLIFFHQNSDYILKIGETDIPEEEYSIIMSSLKDEIIMYYSQNYNETDFSESFWNREYSSDEKTPIEYLKEKTTQKIKENHAVLNLAKKEKLIESDNFEFIYQSFEEENYDRSNKYQNKEEIFGVSGFTIEEYYEYLISNLSIQLRNIISNELTDEEINLYYENNKDEMFCEPIIFECKQVLIEGYSESSTLKNMAKKIVDNVYEGADFEELIYNEGLSLNTMEYDFSRVRSLSIRYPAIVEALGNMNVGEVKLIPESSNAYIIKVCSKSPKKYIPLNQVTQNVKTYLSMEKFDALIQKSLLEIKCKINHRHLNRIDVLT